MLTVDPLAGVDVGNCQAPPCKSIKFAVSKAASGDAINLLSGTYRGKENRDIEIQTANLTIASAGGARDCIVDLESSGRGFILQGAAGFVSIENLTIKNGVCSNDPASSSVNGAGFFLENSHATLRNLLISNMTCTYSSPMHGSFSGAALYLKASHAWIEDIEIVDSFANHGGGLATWGDEQSVVRNAKFLRNGGRFWGGCLLLEQNTSTEFHDCVFSHSKCDYGAALDDGDKAHPLFRNCVFEYGKAVHGAAGYHYGNAKTRYDGVIFRHNQASSSAAVYIVTTSKPSFRNTTFYNNTAGIHAGALRSNYDGKKGPLVFENCRFISNVAKGEQAGALQLHAMDAIFTDCLFEDNMAEVFAGAAAFKNNVAGSPLVFERTNFTRNRAGDAGALYFFGFDAGASANNLPSIVMKDCVFDSNSAISLMSKAGALLYEQAGLLKIDSTTFHSNTAIAKGGAIMISNMNDYSSQIQITNSRLLSNQADGNGGSLYCMQSKGSTTSLNMSNVTIQSSKTYKSGAGIFSDCVQLGLENVSFRKNHAVGTFGNGAGIVLTRRVRCSPSGSPRSTFKDVRFFENVAEQGGAAVYFDHPVPTCRLPVDAGGHWNLSENSTWSWSNVTAPFSKNIAAYGALQATAPSFVKLSCRQQLANSSCAQTSAQNSSASMVHIVGFPGLPISINASLVDGFSQKVLGGLVQVEILKDGTDAGGLPFLLHSTGGRTFLLNQGQASIENVYMLYRGNGSLGVSTMRNGSWGTGTMRLVVRIPKSFVSLRHTQNATVKFESTLCPAGYIQKTHPTVAGAQWCVACEKGQYGKIGDVVCIGCVAGTFSNETGSHACTVCPVGHSCLAGSAAPYQCLAGTFQALKGQSACDACALNHFVSDAGASGCSPCPSGTVTRGSGTASLAGCKCGEETYESHTGSCTPCPDGMACPWGTRGFTSNSSLNHVSSVPRVIPGHWSNPMDPMSVFKCPEADALVCIGGLPGSCLKGGRSGFMCLSCPSGYVRSGNYCGHCSVWNRILIPIMLVVVFCVLVVSYYTSNSILFVNATADLIAAVVLGNLLTMLQVLGMFYLLRVPWSKAPSAERLPESGQPFVGGISHVGVSCMLGESPLLNFYGLVLLPFALTISFLICYCVSHIVYHVCKERRLVTRALCWGGRCPPWEINKVVNTLGSLYLAIFISVATIVASPGQLYRHPNQKLSIIRYPEVLFGEGDYWPLAAMSMFSILLFVLPYVAFCAWGMYQAANHVPRSEGDRCFNETLEVLDGSRAHVMFRFMLYRFRPGCWWWGIPVLIRQLLLAFAPILPAEEPHAQVLYVSFILTCYIALASSYFPWKSDLLNFLDLTLCLGLCLFIASCTSLMKPSKSVAFYEVVMITAICIMVLAKLYVLCMAGAAIIKNGRWAAVEQKIFNGGPPKGLPQLWHDVCVLCSQIPVEDLQVLMPRMTYYDWAALADAADAWHALAPNVFPASRASRHRLIGLEHSFRFRDGRTTAEVVKDITTNIGTISGAITLPSSSAMTLASKDGIERLTSSDKDFLSLSAVPEYESCVNTQMSDSGTKFAL